MAIACPAVITITGSTYYRYYQFWLEHLMPIVGMFYMMYVFEFKPNLKGIAYVLVMLTIIAIPSARLNNAFDECNYLYLKKSTDGGVLSFLPNSVFLTALHAGIITVLFLLDYSIYKLITNKRGKFNA